MPNGGTIVANMNGASSDVTMNVYFKFEKDAYPNTTPDYQTANITAYSWCGFIGSIQLIFHLKARIHSKTS